MRQRLKKMIIAVLTFLALGAAGLMLLLLLFQEKLMYFPSPYTERELAMAQQLGLQRITYSTEAGKQTAFYLPPAAGDNAPPDELWFVYCGNASRVLDLLALFQDLPLATGSSVRRGVLLLDFPGYGLCEGKANPAATLVSGQTGLKTLISSQAWSAEQVAALRYKFLGHSLGCAGTLQLAADLGRAERVILMSPFTSMREMANARVTPAFSWLLRHNFDNRAALTRLLQKSPGTRVTLVHGVRDTAIPVDMSRQLAAGREGTVTLIELPEADHNDFVYDEIALIQGLIVK